MSETTTSNDQTAWDFEARSDLVRDVQRLEAERQAHADDVERIKSGITGALDRYEHRADNEHLEPHENVTVMLATLRALAESEPF